MPRKPVPPSKNLAEQEALRAAKSTNTTVVNTDSDSAKENKSPSKASVKPKINKAIVNKKSVNDNKKSVGHYEVAYSPMAVTTTEVSEVAAKASVAKPKVAVKKKLVKKAAVKKKVKVVEKRKPTVIVNVGKNGIGKKTSLPNDAKTIVIEVPLVVAKKEPVKAAPKPPVKKNYKGIVPNPMTNKEITDSILEDIQEKQDVKNAPLAPENPEPTKENVSVALVNDGEGIDKEFVPFPQTELTNTTTLMVNAYALDCPKLPATILNEINKLNTLFTTFIKEGRVELISVLQGQDNVTAELLSKYVLAKGFVKTAVAGGVPAPVPNGIQVNNADPLPPVQYKVPEFLTSNPTNASPAQPNQIEQQGLAPRIITDINYAKKCADDLMGLIREDWRLKSWGYMPLSVINELIATTNNQFKYEVVVDAVDYKNSFVKITSPEGLVETERFGIL